MLPLIRASGDPETIVNRQSLYIGMIAISGFTALGLALLYRNIVHKESKKIIIPLTYAAIIARLFNLIRLRPELTLLVQH
jgi:hypothetical protein